MISRMSADQLSSKPVPASHSVILTGLAVLLLGLSGCAAPSGYPPLADLRAATEEKPVPKDEIATDPVAEATYNAEVEGWGDRVRSAGVRLCKFFEETGMPMPGFDCPKT